MEKIFVCSPYSGDVEKNVKVAKDYCAKLSKDGKLPFAPHLYFTGFLRDEVECERDIGIAFGIKWLIDCDCVHVLGREVTDGMAFEIHEASKIGKPIYFVDLVEKRVNVAPCAKCEPWAVDEECKSKNLNCVYSPKVEEGIEL